MPSVRCPICQKPFEPQQSTAMPFCSERCRMIDLGKWLDEDYGMPWEPERPPDDQQEET